MSQYANYSTFGNNVQTPASDPLTFCLVDTMDKQFQHGGHAGLYGPRSQKCQAYMAQRCAEKWDGFCEYSYRENNPRSSGWPNEQAWPNTAQSITDSASITGNLSTGSQMLGDAAARRFCKFSGTPRCESFNPMDPNSPKVYYYENCNVGQCGGSNIPVCQVDASTIDNDPLMDRCLENPAAAAPTLINICNTAKRTGANLAGTKIGKFCERYNQTKQAMMRH
jgi:hypothetical protein